MQCPAGTLPGTANRKKWTVNMESQREDFLFSHSVMSNSLGPHEPHHARLPCPSKSAGACSNSCPLSRWCHPTISSSVVPFSCLQTSPASGSFLMSQLFESGGQSIGTSATGRGEIKENQIEKQDQVREEEKWWTGIKRLNVNAGFTFN